MSELLKTLTSPSLVAIPRSSPELLILNPHAGFLWIFTENSGYIFLLFHTLMKAFPSKLVVKVYNICWFFANLHPLKASGLLLGVSWI